MFILKLKLIFTQNWVILSQSIQVTYLPLHLDLLETECTTIIIHQIVEISNISAIFRRNLTLLVHMIHHLTTQMKCIFQNMSFMTASSFLTSKLDKITHTAPESWQNINTVPIFTWLQSKTKKKGHFLPLIVLNTSAKVPVVFPDISGQRLNLRKAKIRNIPGVVR